MSRTRRMLFEQASPESPWLSPGMVEFLSGWLKSSDVLVEFGSGRSTVWFAQRVSKVISCEHDSAWYQEVRDKLAQQGVSNVEYHHPTGELSAQSYMEPVLKLAPGSVDIVLVDGRYRDECAVWAAGVVRPGGLVVVDNANWYLPHATHSPSSVGAHGAPASEVWSQFARLTQAWRCYWASDGVTDTAAFFAPATGG